MRDKEHGIGIGNSLILLIFMVVTLTVFSVLTLVTANSEAATAEKSADNSQSYYRADLEATVKMGQLSDAIKNAASKDEVSDFAAKNGFSENKDENGVTFSFTVQIDEKRELFAELRYENGTLTVNTWKTVSADNDYEQDINVWDGDGLPDGI